jgi:histidine triad (HIT) family protein
MENACLFCKIVRGEIPAKKVFENEHVIGFHDIGPIAKKHYLFIPKIHTANVNELVQTSPESLTAVYAAIAEFSEKDGIAKSGFRVITNQGSDGCQSVFHTHFHVLAGEKLRWG